MTRKVSIQRIEGENHPYVPIGTVHEGWELDPPLVGERYSLFKDCGTIFRSSKVLEVGEEIFRTRNSVYALRVVEQMEECLI